MNMLNGDEAMSPAEFAKLMGAYPQPAENPLPAYGGYMDNSPANFAWVNNNAYFGAEGEKKNCGCGQDPCITYGAESWSETDQYTIEYLLGYGMNVSLTDRVRDMVNDEDIDLDTLEWFINNMTIPFGDKEEALAIITEAKKTWWKGAETFAATPKWECDACGDMHDDEEDAESCCVIECDHSDSEMQSWGSAERGSEFQMYCNSCGADGYGTFGSIDWTHGDKELATTQTAETFEAGTYLDVEPDVMDMLALNGHWWSNDGITEADLKAAGLTTKDDLKGTLEYMAMKGEMWGDSAKDVATVILRKGWGAEETFEAPYGGAGALMDIGKDTPLADFTGKELAESSAIHGDFDQASLNYSGHQNLEVRAEDEMNAEYYDGHDETDNVIGTSGRNVRGNFTYVQHTHIKKYKEHPFADYREHHNECFFEMPIEEFLKRNKKYIIIERDIYDAKDAEMEELTENMVEVVNRFDDSVGRIHVEDVDGDSDDIEAVDVSLEDMDGDMVATFTMSDEYIPDDYLQDDIYATETKKGMWFGLASLALGTLAYLNRDSLTSSVKRVFNNETQEMLENDPELIESPNTGNLDPAQYEELVVESTGYAVDVIPVGLDGSFMGSRFAALPTERYVDYNEPGIGAHTDVALNRDEMYLEPEMAMVQASESVKESEAPGQSPYNSITGEENPDFNYRVLKETYPRSLDPAVKPFIPQDMDGYTGNANTPPSVFNKMFNLGVLGQTPAFVPGSSDMGANHFGSRNATPNTLGLGGVVGGPLSDQVNANYTDGTTSMSLAQWSIENTVSQTSDTEAVVIDRSSGLMKRVRRV